VLVFVEAECELSEDDVLDVEVLAVVDIDGIEMY
jgi:hypothetical protein